MTASNGRLRWYTAISKADNDSDMTSSQFFLIFKWEQWLQTEWLPTGQRQTWTDNNSSGQTRWLWESSFTSESTFHYTIYTVRSRYDPKKSFTLIPLTSRWKYPTQLGIYPIFNSTEEKAPHPITSLTPSSLGQLVPGLQKTILTNSLLTCCDYFTIT